MSGITPGAILALHGLPGAGKDTLADFMVDHFGFHKIAFADGLYREVADAFQVTVPFLRERSTKLEFQESLSLYNCADSGYRNYCVTLRGEDLYSPRTSRYHLDMYGTDYMRYKGTQGKWVDYVVDALRRHNDWNTVITDLRSYTDLREFYAIKRAAAELRAPSCVVRIARAGVPTPPRHEAHEPLPAYAIDLTLTNNEPTAEEFAKSAAADIVAWFSRVRSREL